MLDDILLNLGDEKEFFRNAYTQVGQKKNLLHLACAYYNFKKIARRDVELKQIRKVNNFQTEFFACQMAEGDMDALFGVSANEDAMLLLAGYMARCPFDEIDEDSYDALCEFANLVNGKFVGYMEQDDVDLNPIPPMCCENCKITANGDFCILTISVDGKDLDFISVVDVIPYMR
ncbi:MAG: chemotaxis protein CheX [Lachnospiraceae bacterium]